MHPAIEAVGGLGIDGVGVQDQTAERRLDVSAGTAKTVVKVKMAKGRIEVVAPEQTDDPPAQPNAFRIAGRAIENTLGLGEFIDFLGFLGRVGGRRGRLLIRGLRFRGLGRGYRNDGSDTAEGKTNRNAETADKLKHSMGHGSLDCWARSSRKRDVSPERSMAAAVAPVSRPRQPMLLLAIGLSRYCGNRSPNEPVKTTAQPRGFVQRTGCRAGQSLASSAHKANAEPCPAIRT
jgi:hypothetical protein